MSLAAGRVHSGLTILGCFAGGSLYGWSGYLPVVRAQFDVSNASASMVFSLALSSFTLGVLLGPYLLARIPARYQLALLAGLAVLFLSVAGASSGFSSFALSYGLCFGVISGALYNYAISAASATASATLLVPVSVAAFGLGGAVFGPIYVWLSALGWALWSLTPAIACFVCVAVLSGLMRPARPTEPIEGMRLAKMVKPNKTIVILGTIFATGSCAGLIVLGFASQLLPRGADGVGLVSIAIFFAAIGNTLGRLSSALSASKFGPPQAIAGALCLSIITLCSLMLDTSPGVVVGLLFVAAFAYGQLAATMPLLVKSQVDDTVFAGSFGWVFVGWGIAGLVGPWSAGMLMDATGTFQITLVLCVIFTALSLWLVLGFTKQGKPPEDC